MKANLPQNEPKLLAHWEEMRIYERIRQARKGGPLYVLHDGPPYANGPVHLGTALNKCLKDFIVKSKNMAGFDAPYIPGWDCHGLPIEIKIDDALGRKKLQMAAIDVRRECARYAAKYLDLQREQFKRIGVFGRFHKPYSTMTPEYEAVVLQALFAFVEKDALYKGLRPVYWCIHDKTALAEAEVEYENHSSPSIWVKYALISDPAKIDRRLAGKRVNTIIWTTTPWTLPASMAVAFHPELQYVAFEVPGSNSVAGVYMVADALAENTMSHCFRGKYDIIARFAGSKLHYTEFAHPFLDRKVLGVLANYVTTEQGTGAVHTAPSHGADDFYTGMQYNIPVETNVDEAGRMHNGLPEYEGRTVFEANPAIIDLLKDRGALLHEERIEHSYPHCWRCHRPLIFRATEQWFISMEAALGDSTLRQRALEEIQKVKWDPDWGEERISNMIATRPDWCISRQRVWGVPIAVFFCAQCNEVLRSPEINRAVVEMVRREGVDAWYTREPQSILPPETKCRKCGGSEFKKETDIVDVWFESGSSYLAVQQNEHGLPWPADLYLEGGDQYRGWFHSSLLCAVGVRASAPYRMVATNGWTLDPQGRAMSKSLGNTVDPVDVAKRLGGEIVRLWVASVDFREDVHASEELMQRVAESYRKVRNTFRFILQNLWDFDPVKNAVAFHDMESIDRYMLLETAAVSEEVAHWYDEFQFHKIYQRLLNFCVVDLSALYFDVLKDRLYTYAAKARGRRSAQTAIWKLGEALVRLFAPVMSFTAEEIWRYLPPMEGREASVHLAFFPSAAQITGEATLSSHDQLCSDWATLISVRDEVLKALESARNSKLIGSSLEAAIRIFAPESVLAVLERHAAALRYLFIVSAVTLEPAVSGNGSAGIRVEVTKAPGKKCERCWNYSTRVGENSSYPTICERCTEALEEGGWILPSKQRAE